MTTRPSRKQLIPQWIAFALLVGGLFFAIILTVMLPVVAIIGAWGAAAYFAFGYLVYYGWFWRTRHTPSKIVAMLIWLGSFVVNILPWIFILHQEHWHLPALRGFQTFGALGFGFITFGWWLAASAFSIVALICEFLPRRHNASAKVDSYCSSKF